MGFLRIISIMTSAFLYYTHQFKCEIIAETIKENIENCFLYCHLKTVINNKKENRLNFSFT